MAKQIDIRYTPDRNLPPCSITEGGRVVTCGFTHFQVRFDDAPEKWLDEYEDQDGTLY